MSVINQSVSATERKRAAIQNLINETAEAIRIEQNLYKIRKNGRIQDLAGFYTLQDKLVQQCGSLDLVSPHETRRSHLKQLDEQRRDISSYFTTITQWVKDVEPLIPQYMMCDPVNDLLTRVRQLSKQREELSKRQLEMQRESTSQLTVPSLGLEELERGEIRESPPPGVNPAELLDRIKQFHASCKVVPKDLNSTPFNMDSLLTSESVKCIIRDEIHSILNASLMMVLLNIGSMGDTYVVKAWDLLMKTWETIHAINEHLVQAGTHTPNQQLLVM